MAGPLKPVPEPVPEGSTGPGATPTGGREAEVLAERRARRAELAESELRERLADSERRVAELELVAQESERARADLAARRQRDAGLAALVGEAADAVAAARRAVDSEIQARQAAEAALAAERVARQAAEQAVAAERAARDAAFEAMVAERVRELPGPASASGPPAVDPALRSPGGDPDTGLAEGIAAAAERLRASTAPPPEARDAEAPPAPPAGPRSGGLVGWLEGVLRRRR